MLPSGSKSTPTQPSSDDHGLYIGHSDVAQRKESGLDVEQPGLLPDIMDPRLVLKTVRVFLSSTFTDTKIDRNALMEHVFDPIRELCQQHGITFEVVDLRWGVRQESLDDHRTLDICLEEIKRCQETSLGIAFMALLGDKYGWRPLPPTIIAKELDALLEHIDPSEHQLILEWYLRDDNAIPSSYVLQPISTQFPVRSEDKEVVSKAWKDWGKVEKTIWNSLKSAVDVVEADTEVKRVFTKSVTHLEVEKGVLTEHPTTQQSLVVDRRFDDINEEDPLAHRFQDKQCINLIIDLKENKIPSYLDLKSVLEFKGLQWYREGLTIDHHGSYITDMCSRVKSLLTARINEIISSIGPPDPLREEITRHTLFCRNHVHSFVGRTDTLARIHDYVSKDNPTMPLVLYGESGVGKTTVVAKATMEIQEGNPKMAVLYRFCGTTPEASTGRELTRSLCDQIKHVYNVTDELEEDYGSLCEAFPNVMAHATEKKPLCILIDSLDQLTDENGARRFLEWLPKRIPAHVRLIVSTLPEEGGCLNRLHTFGLPDNNFIHVQRLEPSDGAAIMDTWLQKAKRKLTSEQRDLVLKAFEKCPLPLYLQLVFNECRTWQSYRQLSELSLQLDVVSMINRLYEGLEKYHGKLLVSRVLGLLAAITDGINKDDILHILSCDDQLLNDVLVYHKPPKRRLPPLLLARLKYDLGPFLVERGAHGVALLAFYHRQFIEVATKRYLSGDDYKSTHQSIAKYYSGQYYSQYGKDRAIPSQPTAYSADALNLRKLELVPRTLMEARDFEQLRRWIGDLEFIQAKCMAGLGYDMMAECTLGYQYALEEEKSQEIKNDLDDILGFLRSEVHILSKNPILTFQQAVNYPKINWIGRAAEAMQKGFGEESAAEKSVIPRPDGWVEWINKPEVSEAFEFELDGHSKGVLSTCFSRDNRKILSASEDCSIRLWDSQTGSLLAQLDGHTAAVTSIKTSPDGRLVASSSEDHTIRLWDYEEEKLVRSLEGHERRVTSIAFNGNGTKLLSVSLDKTMRIWDVKTGECVDTITGLSGYPVSCAWSPVDDGIAATCGDQLELLVWDLKDRRVRYKLEGHNIDKAMINFPDKEKLSGLEDIHYDSLLWSVDFSSDGKMLASTGTDSNVFVWDVETGERRCSFSIPNDGSAVCFVDTPQGRRLAAASAPHMTVTLFDVGENPHTIAVLGGHSNWVMGIGFNSDGSRLTSAARDKTIRVWDILAAEKLKEIRCHLERCWCVAYSRDGRWLASASDDFKVGVWDTKTFQPVFVYQGHEKKRMFSCGVRACTFSRDSSLVASGGDEMKIRIWDRETGKDKIVLPCESILLPWCIRFGPDDKRLIAVGEFSKGVLVWDLETETKIADLGGHDRFCQYTEFSPCDKYIISSSVDNTAKVWKADTFDHVATLTHPHWATCGVFSHDGKMIATCSPDLKVRLWSLEDFKEKAAFEGHKSEIRMVSFSPDDCHVASAALDQSIRVWNVKSHAQVHVFHAVSGLWGLMWHPKEMDLLTAGDAVGYLYFLRFKTRDDSKAIKE